MIRQATLLPGLSRYLIAAAWAASLAILLPLSWRVRSADSGTEVDATVAGHLQGLSDHARLMRLVATAGHPAVVVGVSLVAGAVCVRGRRIAAGAFALLSPITTVVVVELVLKPAVNRTLGGSLSFPSGTVAGAFALAACISVLMLPHSSSVRRRTLWGLLCSINFVIATSVSIAVIALGWHYASDALGGAVTACVVVFGLALCCDAIQRLSRTGEPTRGVR